jgi:cytidylate kinase
MNYRNVTISGIAGTGSTTLLRQLKETLGPLGWSGYSGGEFMKQFITTPPKHEDDRHHSAEAYDESIDRMVDGKIRHQLQREEGLIIESWLSGFMAQGVPGVLKVLLTCTNELDRAQRLAERDKMEPAKAMKQAFKRLSKNNGRWSRMYAEEWQDWVIQPGKLPPHVSIFFWHPAIYDVVIDTAVYTPDECLQITLDHLGLDLAEFAPA